MTASATTRTTKPAKTRLSLSPKPAARAPICVFLLGRWFLRAASNCPPRRHSLPPRSSTPGRSSTSLKKVGTTTHFGLAQQGSIQPLAMPICIEKINVSLPDCFVDIFGDISAVGFVEFPICIRLVQVF